jgi:hypothetical protein
MTDERTASAAAPNRDIRAVQDRLATDGGRVPELYELFIDFVRRDIQNERRMVNRRMFSVFLWCFVVPAITTFALILLIKIGAVPRKLGKFTDWIIVGFPVVYALYILFSDMIHELPQTYRRGGVASTLGRALEEARWRDRVCHELRTRFLAVGSLRNGPRSSQKQWPWLIASFRTDLNNLRDRTRYLTALAGAVFFLLIKGLDVFDDSKDSLTSTGSYILGWFESSSSNAAQFIGLALFLVLLYLSGNQAYISLARYLNCLKLLQIEFENEPDHGSA